MKKLLLIIFTCVICYNVNGQAVEISPIYGYQFGSTLGYGPNYLKIKDGGQFGISIGVETNFGVVAEFTYLNMSSELRLRDVVVAPIESRLADLNLDWFLLGGTRYFKQGKVKPFAGAGLGLVVVSPKNENRDIINNNLNGSTKFAFSFKAGVNIMFTDVVGLKLQGDLFFPVDWAGVYVGPGGAGISTGSTVILGSLSGGLVFRFDKN